MKCIYALLLIPDTISKKPDRIVFTCGLLQGWDFRSTEVHRASSSGLPKPEDEPDIVMTIEDYKNVGTQRATYCTQNLGYSEMMAKLTGGTSPMSEQEVLNLDKDTQAVEQCYSHLQNLPRHVGAQRLLRLSKLVKSGKCTARSIATLAFEDRISVEGEYSSFAPASRPSLLKINADYAVKVEDLVLPKNSYIYSRYDKTNALVWYQGKPHVIHKCELYKSAWYMVTELKGDGTVKPLELALHYLNIAHGKLEYLTKESETAVMLDLKREGRINPSIDVSLDKVAHVIREQRRPQKISGVFIKIGDCDSSRAMRHNFFQE